MYINTYINSSDNQKLNKDLTDVELNISVLLKSDTELIEPTLILSPDVDQDFNYFYISEFDRYYFVTARTFSQQRYFVKGLVDVLKSNKDDIEDLIVIAERSSSTYNLYQADNEIPTSVKPLIFGQNFSGSFSGETYILAVTGD